MKIVADASVAVKWLAPSEREMDTERATELLRAATEGRVELLQPAHWQAEVLSVIARLRPQMVDEAVDLIDAMEIAVATDNGVYKRACKIAVQLRQHVFDTLYHAVALEHDALLVTADERYLKNAASLGHITELKAWVPPSVYGGE